MAQDRWTSAIETAAPERETATERLKIMLKMGGLRMVDRDRLECYDPELFETALRRAKAAGLILRREIGSLQGRTLLLWVIPADSAPVSAVEREGVPCVYPGERSDCSFPLCACPVPRP